MKQFQACAFFAFLAGCGAPVSGGGGDPAPLPLDEPVHVEIGIPPGGGSPISVKASTLLSETVGAGEIYPADPATSFPAGRAEIHLWVYLQNESAGIHVAWGIVRNSAGTVVETIPMAFSTTKANVGSTYTVGGWTSKLTVMGTHPADGGAIEFQGDILRAAYSNGTKGAPGTYTVGIVMDDFGVPPASSKTVGGETFSITTTG